MQDTDNGDHTGETRRVGYRKDVEDAGGQMLATFKTRSCAFIPFKFWQGEATLGQDDGRRAPFAVYVVGWRTHVGQAAGR